jgi:hypothetical protein
MSVVKKSPFHTSQKAVALAKADNCVSVVSHSSIAGEFRFQFPLDGTIPGGAPPSYPSPEGAMLE